MWIIDISVKITANNLEHEKYGKDISGDSFGNYCASSQITTILAVGGTKYMCDYSLPVIDFVQPTPKTETKKDLKWKAENLQKAHNNLVVFNQDHLPDPIDYGFDLDVGWTDSTKKVEWCEIVLQKQKRMITLMIALENSLNWLAGEKNPPLTLQERITEDERLKFVMYEQSANLKDVIVDFDC